MEMTQTSNRIHPLMAGAAVSVALVSLIGVAAITGILPNSHGTAAETARVAAQTSTVATAPTMNKEFIEPKPVAHHHHVAQAEPIRQSAPAPAYQQPAPAAQNSPIGIGLGAVVGGLLGSQVGRGNGKTAAEIAGAIGGGYVGNEIAKRN